MNPKGGREKDSITPLSLSHCVLSHPFCNTLPFMSTLPDKKLCRKLKFTLRETRSAHLTFIYFIILIMSVNSTVQFMQLLNVHGSATSIVSSLFGPDILPCLMFSIPKCSIHIYIYIYIYIYIITEHCCLLYIVPCVHSLL